MTIRIWDPEVAGVRAFALDFVDADGNPQRLHGIKVDIRRAKPWPKGEGVILFPDIYTTVPSDTFRIYGGVPCDFDHRDNLSSLTHSRLTCSRGARTGVKRCREASCSVQTT